MAQNSKEISIILPIFNEVENIPILHRELREVLEAHKISYEIIAVDDGSDDGSFEALKGIVEKDQHVKLIRFRRNYGQTSAMRAGFEQAKGDVVLPMDADLQNDPSDIPAFLEKVREGYEVVYGWRKDRKDTLVTRRIPSRIANWCIRRITKVQAHDFGCTMKAFRREVIQGVKLYGEMHRFIPLYTNVKKEKMTEIVVHHRPRTHGKAKYGLGRTYRVMLDLLLVSFLQKYMNRPMHFFGGIGFVSFFFGIVAGGTSVVLKLMEYKSFVETPLPVFSALLLIVGVQLLAMGVIAEMLMRVYYESQHKTPYEVVERINI